MKTFPQFIATLLLATCLAAHAEIPAGWSTNLPAALKDATNSQMPVLVFFTASWCGPCKMMAHGTFMDANVIQVLLAVPRVAIDIDEQSALAEKHSIHAVPTFELLTPAGDTVVSTTGFQTPDQFIPWLTNSIAEAHATVARQNQARAALADADKLLATDNADSMHQAAQKIFELCAAHEAGISQEAIARMQSLAKQHPAILLEALNHPRLATRIQAANILRAQLGASFDIDPWTDAATREKTVTQWREKLAQK